MKNPSRALSRCRVRMSELSFCGWEKWKGLGPWQQNSLSPSVSGDRWDQSGSNYAQIVSQKRWNPPLASCFTGEEWGVHLRMSSAGVRPASSRAHARSFKHWDTQTGRSTCSECRWQTTRGTTFLWGKGGWTLSAEGFWLKFTDKLKLSC